MMEISVHRMLIHLIFLILGGSLVASLKTGDWSGCSATCQTGEERIFRYRITHCDNPNTGDCNATPPEKFPCNLPKCPVDGGWDGWGRWSGCSQTCGSGVRRRQRSCKNPVPSAGGRYCEGHHEKLEYCTNKNPCRVETSRTGWTDWTKCEECKHGAQRIRRRYCTPKSACRINHEDEKDDQVEDCPYDIKKCPVDGKWEPWGSWSDCSVTCDKDNGTETKVRKCTKPERGGQPCKGESTIHKTCQGSAQCPVDCQWSQWGPWKKMGKVRLRSRTRTEAINGGRDCEGNSTEIGTLIPEQIAGSGSGDGAQGDDDNSSGGGAGSDDDNASGTEDPTADDGDSSSRVDRSTRDDEEGDGNPSGNGDPTAGDGDSSSRVDRSTRDDEEGDGNPSGNGG